ncbi:hypothetical protein CTZ28_14630 [Streptomyces shenzhenensis]|uniref:Uncharacterized protein n=1 Tax=Streptomyces shenzhenensis TaxID=943815 RepID=A0A3M0I9G6_9ACTN|nr:hypothetical protein CTZ28_14630 [Streptomyces shenzhenensis]
MGGRGHSTANVNKSPRRRSDGRHLGTAVPGDCGQGHSVGCGRRHAPGRHDREDQRAGRGARTPPCVRAAPLGPPRPDVVAGPLRQLLALDKPGFARVTGHVRAGGLGLPAACDIAAAATAATFAFTEVRTGVAPAVVPLPVIPGRCGRRSLAAESGRGHGLHDVPLEDHEDHDERECGQHGGGHGLGVLDAVGVLHGGDADRQGHQGRVGGGDEGPEEVVPRADEDEDRHGSEHRAGQRHQDRPEDPPVARAVESGRLLQFPRQRVEVLLQDEHHHRGDRLRQDHRGVGVEQMQGEHLPEPRHDQHLRRHQDRGHRDREQPAAAGEAGAREGVSGHRGDQHGDHRDGRRDEQAVQHPQRQVAALPHGAEPLEGEAVPGPEPVGRVAGVPLRLERGQQPPGHRQQPCGGRQGQRGQGEHPGAAAVAEGEVGAAAGGAAAGRQLPDRVRGAGAGRGADGQVGGGHVTSPGGAEPRTGRRRRSGRGRRRCS